MSFLWDPVSFVNLIFCIVIVVLGLIIYRKSGENLPLFIAIVFGLFGITHAATLAGLALAFPLPLIIIRAVAYLLVIYALYLHFKSTFTQKK